LSDSFRRIFMRRSTSSLLNITGAATRSFPCPTGSDGCISQRLSGMPKSSSAKSNVSERNRYGGEILGIDASGKPRWPACGTGFKPRRLHRPLLVPELSVLGAQREIRGAPLRPLGVRSMLRPSGGGSLGSFGTRHARAFPPASFFSPFFSCPSVIRAR